MSNLRNPYSSADPTSGPPPFAPGLNPYAYKNLRNGYDIYVATQLAHASAFPPVPDLRDPSNTLPKLEPLYYKQYPNFNYLDNPTPMNINNDRRIEHTYINPSLTQCEGFPSLSKIKIGQQQYRNNLGPVFF
jgi:hypothetical protein